MVKLLSATHVTLSEECIDELIQIYKNYFSIIENYMHPIHIRHTGLERLGRTNIVMSIKSWMLSEQVPNSILDLNTLLDTSLMGNYNDFLKYFKQFLTKLSQKSAFNNYYADTFLNLFRTKCYDNNTYSIIRDLLFCRMIEIHIDNSYEQFDAIMQECADTTELKDCSVMTQLQNVYKFVRCYKVNYDSYNYVEFLDNLFETFELCGNKMEYVPHSVLIARKLIYEKLLNLL